MKADKLKEKLVQKCVAVQQAKADLAKEAMQDMQQQANDYGCPRDKYDAFRNQLLRKRDLFAVQYQNALDDLTILERIDTNNSCEKVEFGSIVQTRSQTLFIALGIGKFVVDDFEYFAISPKVPIYNTIKGLIEGDEYEFNNKKFQILKIH